MFFKKAKPKEVQKPKTKLTFKNEKIDVGFVLVELTDVNGEKFTTTVYGDVKQHIPSNLDYFLDSDYIGNRIGIPTIISASEMARLLISEIHQEYYRTFVDDPKNIEKSMSSKFYKAEIKNGGSYLIDFNVAYLENI